MEGELRAVREQMRSDFKTVMAALAVQHDSVARALQAQEEILAGWMERVDHRLDAIERQMAG